MTEIGQDILDAVGFTPEAPGLRPRRAEARSTSPSGTSACATTRNEQYVEVTAEFSRYVDDPYVEPGFTREPVFDEVEVTIIGGGFGGLLMGARLREAGYGSIRLVEKAGDVGGTWYWNRYPGAMCDVESYVYLPLLEELGYMPSTKYPFAPEIFEHSKAIARHFGLYDERAVPDRDHRVALGRGRRRAGWCKTDRGDAFRTQFIAMANGPLSRPKLPGHPRHQRLQGLHVPHQPLGLRLHRR